MMVQKSGYDELRLVVYPIRVIYIPGGFLTGFLSHQRQQPASPWKSTKTIEAEEFPRNFWWTTLPKTNIAPEKVPSQ